MLAKTLCPTDFSDVSLKALEYIRHLKRTGIESAILLHVINGSGFAALDRYRKRLQGSVRVPFSSLSGREIADAG